MPASRAVHVGDVMEASQQLLRCLSHVGITCDRGADCLLQSVTSDASMCQLLVHNSNPVLGILQLPAKAIDFFIIAQASLARGLLYIGRSRLALRDV